MLKRNKMMFLSQHLFLILKEDKDSHNKDLSSEINQSCVQCMTLRMCMYLPIFSPCQYVVHDWPSVTVWWKQQLDHAYIASAIHYPDPLQTH